MRKDSNKIGYILGFNEVIDSVIQPFLSEQIITQAVSTDYLGQRGII